MAHLTLKIPKGLANKTMKRRVDDLKITVTEDCTWCYDDPDNVFAGGILPAGRYLATNPHTTYGPYIPVNPGTFYFDAVTSGDCVPMLKAKHHKHDPLTGHSIIVT